MTNHLTNRLTNEMPNLTNRTEMPNLTNHMAWTANQLLKKTITMDSESIIEENNNSKKLQ
jgi:hypothetical protein